MKIFKNLFGKGDKIHVDEIAVAPDLLLGSAVIIEKGSNANGNYVKFGDGTMICTHTMGNVLIKKVAVGSGWRSDSIDWTFPVPFSSQPDFSHSVSGGQVNILTGNGVNGLTESLASVVAISLTDISSSANCRISLIAIGRWK